MAANLAFFAKNASEASITTSLEVRQKMQICPFCQEKIVLRELPYQGLFKTFRICPKCGGRFTVDIETKRWQAVCLIIGMISLCFTLLMYYVGSAWIMPSLLTYIILALIIYWRNKRVFLVPYKDLGAKKDS